MNKKTLYITGQDFCSYDYFKSNNYDGFYFSLDIKFINNNIVNKPIYMIFFSRVYNVTRFMSDYLNIVFFDLLSIFLILINYIPIKNYQKVYLQYRQNFFLIFLLRYFFKKKILLYVGEIPRKGKLEKLYTILQLRLANKIYVESNYIAKNVDHTNIDVIGTFIEHEKLDDIYLCRSKIWDYILIGFPKENKGIMDFIGLLKNQKKNILIISNISEKIEEDNVLVIPYRVSSVTLWKFLSRSITYVNVSPSEGGPRVLLEALKLKCKVKSLKNSIAPDLLPNENIELFDDIKSLVNTL